MIKNRYWHKLFLAAGLSLVALSGCKKVAEPEVVVPDTEKLYFNSTLEGLSFEGVATRGYANDIDFASRGFTVTAYNTNGLFATDNLNNLPFPNFFDYKDPGVDPAVLTIKIDNSETNVNRKYWTTLPRLPLSTLFRNSFFAWSASADGVITDATKSAADKGAPWLDVKVGAANTTQPDVVGAKAMNYSAEYTVSAVDLDFKHLLSKMSFSIKGVDGLAAKLTKIECIYDASSVYNEARFTFDSTSTKVGTWGAHKSYQSAGAVELTNWNLLTSSATATHIGSMVFIPQDLKAGAISLRVTYTIDQGGVTSGELTRTIPLEAITMESGKNYVYTLDMSANKVEIVRVKVTDWIDMAGNDTGLPVVPGAMDPMVVLLLEGVDAPFVAYNGNKYWLDRSGWNNHCQIMDRTQYNGTGAFDITYSPQDRGYMFNRSSFGTRLYNHIRIPDLGVVQGNFGCEIVCEDKGTTHIYPQPLTITQEDVWFGEAACTGRTLVMSVNEDNSSIWDYAKGAPITGGYERLQYKMSTSYDWGRRSFYAFSRIDGDQKFLIVNNTNSLSEATNINSNAYNMKSGAIGTNFKGIINYVKITKRVLTFDKAMEDFMDVAKKYRITTAAGPYAKDLPSGLLACWDARSGLVQGESNGNGAYWMDQSGNGYYLKGLVPSYSTGSIKHDVSNNAMVFSRTPGSSSNDFGFINPYSMGKTKVLTFELVYQGQSGLTFGLQFLNSANGVNAVNCRPFTGDGSGFELGHNPLLDYSGEHRLAHLYYGRTADVAQAKQHAVGVINYEQQYLKLYINGVEQPKPSKVDEYFMTGDRNTIMELGYTILGNRKGFFQSYIGNFHAFRVYNRELTQSEIRANYNRDKAAFNLP